MLLYFVPLSSPSSQCLQRIEKLLMTFAKKRSAAWVFAAELSFPPQTPISASIYLTTHTYTNIMATPKGSSTPKPIRQPDRPTEPDPSDLLEKLSLQQSSSQDIPLPSAPASGTSIDSQASSLHRAHLESVQRSRVHALELSEQSLFLPLLPSVLPFASFAKIGGGMGRGLDPKVLVAKVLDLAGDRGPIRRRSRREIECDDGMRWEVVLEGERLFLPGLLQGWEAGRDEDDIEVPVQGF
jgi:hypothetical protein